MTNVERLIADSINNNPIEVELRGKKINIPRPTLGTMIEASKYIAKLPEFDLTADYKQSVQLTLNIAKDCGKVPEILAVLMLGKKDMYQKFTLFGKTFILRNRFKKLTKEIENLTPQESGEILVKILSSMDCGFFLGIIISLQGINQLKKTKTETTVSGQ